MKKNVKAHGNRRRNMVKAIGLFRDPMAPWGTMALIRLHWDEELAA